MLRRDTSDTPKGRLKGDNFFLQGPFGNVTNVTAPLFYRPVPAAASDSRPRIRSLRHLRPAQLRAGRSPLAEIASSADTAGNTPAVSCPISLRFR